MEMRSRPANVPCEVCCELAALAFHQTRGGLGRDRRPALRLTFRCAAGHATVRSARELLDASGR
jgi:hypothetical protein